MVQLCSPVAGPVQDVKQVGCCFSCLLLKKKPTKQTNKSWHCFVSARAQEDEAEVWVLGQESVPLLRHFPGKTKSLVLQNPPVLPHSVLAFTVP